MSNEKYTISELAAEFDISPSTIRFYEEKGLLSPERSQGNQRVYSYKHRKRLKLILRGKRFGASLDEGSFGGRGPLRAPDPKMEPQDGPLHLY